MEIGYNTETLPLKKIISTFQFLLFQVEYLTKVSSESGIKWIKMVQNDQVYFKSVTNLPQDSNCSQGPVGSRYFAKRLVKSVSTFRRAKDRKRTFP